MQKRKDVEKSTSTSSSFLPRVTQHETLHTLNLQLQQTALSALAGPSRYNDVQRGCKDMQSLARKATLRLDTSIKHMVCRGCATLLLPGATSTTRIKPHKVAGLMTVTTCSVCEERRKSMRPSPATDVTKKRARKRLKRAQEKEVNVLRAKVRRIEARFAYDGKDCSAHSLPLLGSTRAGQRTRRRLARGKALALDDTGVSTSRPKRRRRAKRGTGGCQSETAISNDQIVHKAAEILHAVQHRQKKKTERPRHVIRRIAGLPPYSERTRADTGDTDWLGAVTEHLDTSQRNVLRSIRGDHVITQGLGRGGTVGEVL